MTTKIPSSSSFQSVSGLPSSTSAKETWADPATTTTPPRTPLASRSGFQLAPNRLPSTPRKPNNGVAPKGHHLTAKPAFFKIYKDSLSQDRLNALSCLEGNRRTDPEAGPPQSFEDFSLDLLKQLKTRVSGTPPRRRHSL